MSKKAKKGKLLVSGKTKEVHLNKTNTSQVIVTNRDDITANDNPNLTKDMEGKGAFATNITVNMFELLKKAGIPVAYVKRMNEQSFVAEKTEMIPLEVIMRRYAVGSYTKRMPHLGVAEGELPYRFSNLLFEVFLKTSNGKCERNDEELLDGLKVDDPLILNPYEKAWRLYEPKQPSHEDSAYLKKKIDSESVLQGVDLKVIELLTRKIFLLLEAAWAINYGYRLVDFKIEFGMTHDGRLVVSDVIDNDSWRLRTDDWKELSKENFRQGMSLADVSETYELVSILSDRLPNVPEQAIIFWRGSVNDVTPSALSIEGIEYEDIVISAHKQPGKVFKELNKLEAKYPQGAVIIAMAGMSNGLGPTLSAQTSWPVISCPPGIKDNPNDIWSSVNLPSNVPGSTVINPKNAVLHSLNILAISNSIAAMQRRYEVEKIVNS